MSLLDAPYTTLKRARKDLRDFKQTLSLLEKGQHSNIVVANPNPNGGALYTIDNPMPDLSVDVGVITGQLRAVLDQVVHALFELRQGNPPSAKRRTQFPICDTPNDFKSRITPDLHGLDIADIAVIEKSQPYHGQDWLRELKLLAEQHKHRRLIFLRALGGARFHAHAAADSHLLALPGGGWIASTMQVDAHIPGPIVFEDGTPAIDKLQILEAEIAQVVNAFKPLFN